MHFFLLSVIILLLHRDDVKCFANINKKFKKNHHPTTINIWIKKKIGLYFPYHTVASQIHLFVFQGKIVDKQNVDLQSVVCEGISKL